MDGSRFIPDIGLPSTVSSISVGDTNSAAPSLTSAPVPLSNAGKFTYAIAQGNNIIFGNESTSQIIAALPNEKPIIQLLADREAIYAIHSDGNIHALDHSGKIIWQYRTSEFDESDPHSILTKNSLIAEADTGIIAIDLLSGKKTWSCQTVFPPHNIIYDSKSKLLIAAISFDGDAFAWGDSIYNRATDSILCINSEGIVKSRIGFPKTRIISNLSICGKDKNLIAFGYLLSPSAGEMRTIHIGVFSGIETGSAKKLSDHELTYLPTQVCSNGPLVLASGFYGSGSNLESGIDAFYADDIIKLWQRRFTYPLVTPIAINNKYAYFHLSFSAQAIVPAKSIFYTLELTTGKTVVELPIAGAENGFRISTPMPLAEQTLILADAIRPVIYFLKP